MTIDEKKLFIAEYEGWKKMGLTPTQVVKKMNAGSVKELTETYTQYKKDIEDAEANKVLENTWDDILKQKDDIIKQQCETLAKQEKEIKKYKTRVNAIYGVGAKKCFIDEASEGMMRRIGLAEANTAKLYVSSNIVLQKAGTIKILVLRNAENISDNVLDVLEYAAKEYLDGAQKDSVLIENCPHKYYMREIVGKLLVGVYIGDPLVVQQYEFEIRTMYIGVEPQTPAYVVMGQRR